jgi:hypothetical protein
MNIALWIVAGLLAVAYVGGGGLKVIMSKQKIAASGPAAGWVEDFSPGAVKAIGVLEVLGGLGLVLPAALGVAPRAGAAGRSGPGDDHGRRGGHPHQPARVPVHAGGPDLSGPDRLRGLGPVRSGGVRGLTRPVRRRLRHRTTKKPGTVEVPGFLHAEPPVRIELTTFSFRDARSCPITAGCRRMPSATAGRQTPVL